MGEADYTLVEQLSEHAEPSPPGKRVEEECPDCRDILDDIRQRDLAYDEANMDPRCRRRFEQVDHPADTDEYVFGSVLIECPKGTHGTVETYRGWMEEKGTQYIPARAFNPTMLAPGWFSHE